MVKQMVNQMASDSWKLRFSKGEFQEPDPSLKLWWMAWICLTNSRFLLLMSYRAGGILLVNCFFPHQKHSTVKQPPSANIPQIWWVVVRLLGAPTWLSQRPAADIGCEVCSPVPWKRGSPHAETPRCALWKGFITMVGFYTRCWPAVTTDCKLSRTTTYMWSVDSQFRWCEETYFH